MGRNNGLTKTQARVLDYVRSYIQRNDFPPSRAEINKHFGWMSPNAAQSHLRAISRKGYLKLSAGLSRGITLL